MVNHLINSQQLESSLLVYTNQLTGFYMVVIIFPYFSEDCNQNISYHFQNKISTK